MAHAARRAGLSALALAGQRAHEARLIDGLEIAVVERLESAVRVLNGEPGDPLPAPTRSALGEAAGASAPELGEVLGQHHAVRALIIAAAGGHNLLLSGSPGTGKTMLAQRLPAILPSLSDAEAIDVTRIHGLLRGDVEGLVRRRPFRAPHHSVTAAGLIGGASRGWVGEAVLAHNGVLFLDELAEFSRQALEALRQPLEEGRVVIARARRAAAYPARFMLVGATNPCPCGMAAELERCPCTEAELARHRRRLSGPLQDRIDLLAVMRRERGVGGERSPLMSTQRARERVLLARERQARRLQGERVQLNARMDASMLARHVRLDARGGELLRSAGEQGMLSARGQHRVLRVARTIADLSGSRYVAARHVGAALAMRPECAPATRTPA